MGQLTGLAVRALTQALLFHATAQRARPATFLGLDLQQEWMMRARRQKSCAHIVKTHDDN
jgi:hypothetical protein